MTELDYVVTAIGWVREDLDDSLATIREELEAFAEDTGRKEPQ